MRAWLNLIGSITLLVLITDAPVRAFEPRWKVGNPAKGTAQAAFEEYYYQATTQFNVWGHAHLKSMGLEKLPKGLGGNERSFWAAHSRIAEIRRETC